MTRLKVAQPRTGTRTSTAILGEKVKELRHMSLKRSDQFQLNSPPVPTPPAPGVSLRERQLSSAPVSFHHGTPPGPS